MRGLARQLIQAVDHLHRHQICHRDLKPDNVLVTVMDDEVLLKVIDFNVAVDLRDCQ